LKLQLLTLFSRELVFEPRIAGNSAGSGVIQVFFNVVWQTDVGVVVVVVVFYNSPEIFVNKENYTFYISVSVI